MCLLSFFFLLLLTYSRSFFFFSLSSRHVAKLKPLHSRLPFSLSLDPPFARSFSFFLLLLCALSDVNVSSFFFFSAVTAHTHKKKNTHNTFVYVFDVGLTSPPFSFFLLLLPPFSPLFPDTQRASEASCLCVVKRTNSVKKSTTVGSKVVFL